MQYTQQKPESIQSLFNTIAPRYDKANSMMSFHMHALWNRTLAKRILMDTPTAIIDLCSGTGEIAFRLLDSSASIDLVDFSEEMLKVAELTAQKLPEELRKKLTFLKANVEELPYSAATFSHASCSYGIRNVQNPQKCLAEMYRVLKPGGKAYILELTRPKNPMLRRLHRLYLHLALPLIGKWLTKNKEAYSYLQKSIETFVSPDELVEKATTLGFRKATIERFSFGIATLITLEK